MGYVLECPPFIDKFFYIIMTICYFSSQLVNSGCFQFTSTIPTTVLMVELVVIKHGHHVFSCSYWQPQGGCFLCCHHFFCWSILPFMVYATPHSVGPTPHVKSISHCHIHTSQSKSAPIWTALHQWNLVKNVIFCSLNILIINAHLIG